MITEIMLLVSTCGLGYFAIYRLTKKSSEAQIEVGQSVLEEIKGLSADVTDLRYRVRAIEVFLQSYVAKAKPSSRGNGTPQPAPSSQLPPNDML